jgi:transcriptional regulator with XRE-family HTH domain
MATTKTIFNKHYVKFIADLVKLRNDKKWSQRKLAAALNIPVTSVARIELRERRLDLVETIDYLRALGLSKSEIIEKIGELV